MVIELFSLIIAVGSGGGLNMDDFEGFVEKVGKVCRFPAGETDRKRSGRPLPAGYKLDSSHTSLSLVCAQKSCVSISSGHVKIRYSACFAHAAQCFIDFLEEMVDE